MVKQRLNPLTFNQGQYKARRGTTQETQWENARTSMENARPPWEKTRSPSLAFAMEGLSEEGGDLLSRIAVQYHRRARA